MRVHTMTIYAVAGLSILLAGVACAEDIGEVRADEAGASLVGTRAPDVELSLMDGGTVSLKALRGHKPVYLKFWATWCIPCREQMKHLQSVYETHSDDIEVIAVNAGLNETPEAIRAFRKEYSITMPVAVDTDDSIGRAFKLTVTPQHVLIDRAGTIQYVGHLASAELDQALADVMKDGDDLASHTRDDAKAKAEDDDASITLLDGSTLQMNDNSDKPVVLFFFATWCDWYLADTRPAMSAKCVTFQKHMSELREQYGDRVRWVGIAQSLWTDNDDLKAYQEKFDVTYALGLDIDSAWFARYNIRNVPTIVVLDSKGETKAIVADDAAKLDAALAALVGGS